MPLSELHVLNVCKKNAGDKECRYLSSDGIDDDVFQCLKLTTQKKTIDDMVEKHADKKGSAGYFFQNDPPLGDNCQGYPVLRHKIIGFDVD